MIIILSTDWIFQNLNVITRVKTHSGRQRTAEQSFHFMKTSFYEEINKNIQNLCGLLLGQRNHICLAFRKKVPQEKKKLGNYTDVCR